MVPLLYGAGCGGAMLDAACRSSTTITSLSVRYHALSTVPHCKYPSLFRATRSVSCFLCALQAWPHAGRVFLGGCSIRQRRTMLGRFDAVPLPKPSVDRMAEIEMF